MTRQPERASGHLRLAAHLILLAALLGAACSGAGDRADAYGNFEAVEVLVSSEASGALVSFDADEGATLDAGVKVGLVDTTQLSLRRSQLQASLRGVLSRVGSVRAQVRVLEEQRRVAMIEKQRVDRLIAEDAATQQQLDDVDGRIAVLDRQIDQTRAQEATIFAEADALRMGIEQIDDQIRKSTITNPVHGTVLTTFVEPHEVVSHGRPLYKIADLSSMELRAYVGGDQLHGLRIAQTVEVRIDAETVSGGALTGRVTWIAAEAEFTPKIIQTREERVNLVYAFKVRVDNPDGTLKIGMPGEVWFKSN